MSEAIRSGRAPLLGRDDAVGQARALEALLRSAEQGSPVARRMTRVGIIGYGLAGEVFHAPLVDAVDGLEVAAIVTRRRGPAAARGRRLSGGEGRAPPWTSCWPLVEAMVVVASSNRSHVPLAMAARRAGLPVVVDKPLAPRARRQSASWRPPRRRGVLLTVFQNRRWDGDFLTRPPSCSTSIGLADFALESRFERFEPEPSGGWRELGGPRRGRRAAVGSGQPT